MTVDYIGFAYAATVAAGGIIGYAKAGMTRLLIIYNNFTSIFDNDTYVTVIPSKVDNLSVVSKKNY